MDEDGEAGKALSWFPHLNFLNWKSFFFLNLIKLMFIYFKIYDLDFCFNFLLILNLTWHFKNAK